MATFNELAGIFILGTLVALAVLGGTVLLWRARVLWQPLGRRTAVQAPRTEAPAVQIADPADIDRFVLDRTVRRMAREAAWQAERPVPAGARWEGDSPLSWGGGWGFIFVVQHPGYSPEVRSALAADEAYRAAVARYFRHTDPDVARRWAERMVEDGYWRPLAATVLWACGQGLIGGPDRSAGRSIMTAADRVRRVEQGA